MTADPSYFKVSISEKKIKMRFVFLSGIALASDLSDPKYGNVSWVLQ